MGDASLRYTELDARTNQLAHALRAAGAGPESRVGVLMTCLLYTSDAADE